MSIPKIPSHLKLKSDEPESDQVIDEISVPAPLSLLQQMIEVGKNQSLSIETESNGLITRCRIEYEIQEDSNYVKTSTNGCANTGVEKPAQGGKTKGQLGQSYNEGSPSESGSSGSRGSQWRLNTDWAAEKKRRKQEKQQKWLQKVKQRKEKEAQKSKDRMESLRKSERNRKSVQLSNLVVETKSVPQEGNEHES